MIAQFDYRILADVNALLNAVALLLIICGLVAVRWGRVKLHKRLMLGAAAISGLFLASYLTYHANADPVRFEGEGALRSVYLFILLTHIVLAAVQVPLIVLTILWGVRDQQTRHRKIARITAAIWLYVSATGVAVYGMLYQL